MQADLIFQDVTPGKAIQVGNVAVEPIGLNRNALGYRLSCQGVSIVYATDTNHEQVDENLAFMAHQADLVIYDGVYVDLCDQLHLTPAPKPWQAAIQLVKSAQVKQLVMVHYGPRQTDVMLTALAHQLQAIEPRILLAREGSVIEFCSH